MVDKNFGLGKTLKDIYKNTKPDESAAFYSLQAADKSLAEKQQSLAKEQQNQKKIDQLESQIEILKESKYIDSFTGLENKDAFDDYINRLNLTKLRHPLVCFVIDINDLKPVNDNYGHLAGDKLIKSMADLIQSKFRQDEDRLFRGGGRADEFIVVSTLNPDSPNSIIVDEYINKKITQLKAENKTIEHNDKTIPLEFAIAAVEYNKEKHQNLKDVYDEADKKMLQNKKEMKNPKKEEADKVQELSLASNNLLD